MNIVHVTPHLGGGVGKAHAAIRKALPKEVEQTFVLLEEARDRRHADLIESYGARVVVARGPDDVADWACTADIVQFEFWNHPLLFESLGRSAFPAMRSVFWSHVSGCFRPVIPPGLIEQAARFVFSTEASCTISSMALVSTQARRKTAVINSGFGFSDPPRRAPRHSGKPTIAYLGTVDFVKMHPGFFDAIEGLDGDVEVSVWGSASPPVIERASAMRHPERVLLRGHTDDPARALASADIFFYPLQPDHYGTAENALIEAMSLGLVPVVLNNPAETAIVRHGETGFVARSVEECTSLLQMLLDSPDVRDGVARNAVRHVAGTRVPARSAGAFLDLWQGLLGEPKQPCNFRHIVGEAPAEWFLATQCLPGEAWMAPADMGSDMPSKGTLAHFESAFPHDVSLSRLAAVRGQVL
jgi:glycosyltransferase involved in cell wall biosynthesis